MKLKAVILLDRMASFMTSRFEFKDKVWPVHSWYWRHLQASRGRTPELLQKIKLKIYKVVLLLKEETRNTKQRKWTDWKLISSNMFILSHLFRSCLVNIQYILCIETKNQLYYTKYCQQQAHSGSWLCACSKTNSLLRIMGKLETLKRIEAPIDRLLSKP